ncbi:uncharacterized protein RBU57_011652 isoform 2-T2 [Macrochelys suwanniensis]
MSAMKTLLALVIFMSLAAERKALKCHSCIASNEDDCNQQGSHSCPQYADACSTIVATGSSLLCLCHGVPGRCSGTTPYEARQDSGGASPLRAYCLQGKKLTQLRPSWV